MMNTYYPHEGGPRDIAYYWTGWDYEESPRYPHEEEIIIDEYSKKDYD